MEKKSIVELMAEITEQAKELERMSKTVATPNKIWIPTVGVVKLWGTDAR
jgi:hypothetical protein